MANINDVYGSGLLKAEDLVGHGVVKLTISGVATKDFEDGTKLIIGFRGKDKQLVCNKTNGARIAELLGNDYDNWVGGEIELFATKVDFSGKRVDAIRVHLPETPGGMRDFDGAPPAAATRAPAAGTFAGPTVDEDDSIPF